MSIELVGILDKNIINVMLMSEHELSFCWIVEMKNQFLWSVCQQFLCLSKEVEFSFMSFLY